MTEPAVDLDARYGEAEATPVPWPEAQRLLETAELYWISTVHPSGRPHVTPLLAVWRAGALHVCTGAEERKARNIEANPQVTVTTGRNDRKGGTDVVLEGDARRVTDRDELAALAAAWETKYGPEWHFDVADGGFYGAGGVALVYRLEPVTAYAFGKAPYSQTRYRFAN
ncbi:pyridoxamine 5'-phosphate oxidase family protein [Pseudonocardia sp. TRM90224]|uniref:pyridoxamine 5'-phosphate oxidase family protein n=1 Tax=Pseudonocardia sp. TRM90224 TaxID=2812678 RepID=UPI001E40A42A|nr:pyridoxamine 5'-phosphate oxidase family protein [Pseudonocardia sp. TRM90224]